MAWQLGLLALVACAVPVGIENLGQYCFLSSLLQILFYLPHIRKRIYEIVEERVTDAAAIPDDIKGLFYIAAVFGRLQEAKTRPVNITQDLYKYFVADAAGKGGFMIQENRPNDQDEAFSWLTTQLKFLEKEHLVGFTSQETKAVRGIVYKTVKLREMTCNVTEDLTLERIVLPTPYDGLREVDATDTPEQERQLTAIGVQPRAGLRMNVEITKSIVEPNGVLIFKLRGFDYETDRPTEIIRHYPETLRVDSIDYKLLGLTVYIGGGKGGHYYAYIQTNVSENTWHYISDDVVVDSNLETALRQTKSVYYAVYVRADTMEEWRATADPDVLYKPKIPQVILDYNATYKPSQRRASTRATTSVEPGPEKPRRVSTRSRQRLTKTPSAEAGSAEKSTAAAPPGGSERSKPTGPPADAPPEPSADALVKDSPKPPAEKPPSTPATPIPSTPAITPTPSPPGGGSWGPSPPPGGTSSNHSAPSGGGSHASPTNGLKAGKAHNSSPVPQSKDDAGDRPVTRPAASSPAQRIRAHLRNLGTRLTENKTVLTLTIASAVIVVGGTTAAVFYVLKRRRAALEDAA